LAFHGAATTVAIGDAIGISKVTIRGAIHCAASVASTAKVPVASHAPSPAKLPASRELQSQNSMIHGRETESLEDDDDVWTQLEEILQRREASMRLHPSGNRTTNSLNAKAVRMLR
jgi:hypothetical protein